MASAKQQVGVRPGYKARERRVRVEERREPSQLQKIVGVVLSNARDVREFVADEIVYATMDTIRLWEWLRYELGFRTTQRVKPMVYELEQFVHERELMNTDGPLVRDQAKI